MRGFKKLFYGIAARGVGSIHGAVGRESFDGAAAVEQMETGTKKLELLDPGLGKVYSFTK